LGSLGEVGTSEGAGGGTQVSNGGPDGGRGWSGFLKVEQAKRSYYKSHRYKSRDRE